MTRLCGRARKGERLLAPVPHGYWKTTTFVAGLRLDRITAPLLIDCPMNGHIFETYVKKCLAPTLNPGDIVVMDNLSAHKGKGIRQAIGDIKALIGERGDQGRHGLGGLRQARCLGAQPGRRPGRAL